MSKLSMNCEKLYNRYGALKAGELIKEAGFDGVDFAFFRMVNDENDPFLKDDYLETSHKIRSEFDSVGLVVNQAHAPFSFPLEKFLDKDALENVIYPKIIRSMEVASIFGAKIIVVHPIHYTWIGKEEAYLKNIEFYSRLLPYCEKFGIKVAVENMWDFDRKRGYIIHDTCSTKEEFVSYIDNLNDKNIVACLDLGHVGLPIQDDEAHDFIYALGKDRLKALHIHDNGYKADDHVMPFRGKMNWEAIGKALGEIDYDGYFTYEIVDSLTSTLPDSLMKHLLKLQFETLKYIVDIADSYRPSK